jgi:hypothetical protein
MVLDSCAEIVKGCRALARMLCILDGENGVRIVLENIESYSLRIQRHRKKAYFLLDRCLAAADLVR